MWCCVVFVWVKGVDIYVGLCPDYFLPLTHDLVVTVVVWLQWLCGVVIRSHRGLHPPLLPSVPLKLKLILDLI